MTRKKKTPPHHFGRLTEGRYQKLLLALLEAWESSDQGKDVFWDYGPGERPQKIIAEFRCVAKRESIPVKTTNLGSSLKMSFPHSVPNQTIRVRAKSGDIKARVLK